MSYADEVLADAPLVWLRLGDATGSATALDSSGNAHPGTAVSSPTFGVSGALRHDDDTAMTLDGTDYVSIPDGAWMDVAEFTVEAWAKTTSVVNGMVACRDPGGGVDRAWQFRVDSDGQFRDDLHSVIASGFPVNDGFWHHLCLTVNAGGARLYIDGVERDTSTDPYSPAVPDAIIVGRTNWGAESFVGQIDEFAYYGTALTAARVAAHYDVGIGATPPGGVRRMYLSSDAMVPAISPVSNTSLWETAPSVKLGQLQTTPSDTTTGPDSNTALGVVNQTLLLWKHVSVDPLNGGRIGGGVADVIVTALNQWGGEPYSYLMVAVSVWSANGATLRGVLGSGVSSVPVSQHSNRTSTVTFPLGYLNVQDGDLLVVESGQDVGSNPFTQNNKVGMHSAAEDADFPFYPGLDFGPREWIEFSSDPYIPYGTYVAEVIADNPLAWWRHGEAPDTLVMNDSSGNDHHGTYSASVVLGVDGLLTDDPDTAMYLNDMSALGTATDGAWIDVATISVESWVTPDSLTSELGQNLCGRDQGSFVGANKRCWHTRIGPTGLPEFVFWAEDGGSEIVATGSEPAQAGIRNHVVGTYDGLVGRVYLNGILTGEAPAAGALNTGQGGVVKIGLAPPVNDHDLVGVVDETALYGEALSPDRVLAHYNAGVGVVPPVKRNLVINPSGEQNYNAAWGASNGTVETNIVWEV